MSTSEDPSGTSTEAAPAVGSTRPLTRVESHFPLIELTGGPHGKNAKYLVDGIEQKGVSRVEIDVSVSDAIRIKTHQIASVNIVVSVDGDHITNLARVVLQKHDPDGLSYEVVAHFEGPTLWEAVQACADHLRAESEQTSPESGTVTGP